MVNTLIEHNFISDDFEFKLLDFEIDDIFLRDLNYKLVFLPEFKVFNLCFYQDMETVYYLTTDIYKIKENIDPTFFISNLKPESIRNEESNNYLFPNQNNDIKTNYETMLGSEYDNEISKRVDSFSKKFNNSIIKNKNLRYKFLFNLL